MMLETFFEKFDLFADAPGAVAKMRELVLELAVQGRLVEQDRNDEPAIELLDRLPLKDSNGRIADKLASIRRFRCHQMNGTQHFRQSLDMRCRLAAKLM